ncbi:MAG TPA: hypothetical protein PLN21_16990 [Gemmatales bacterium]|nr:hypothetical protein [Gemmatales bacterium]
MNRHLAMLSLFTLSAFCLSSARADDASVSGKFTGNGNEAKLAFISATKGEPLSDKPTIQIIMTEKDHSKEKRAAFKAGFGDFGSALLITVFHDGKIVGCEVAHSAHERKPFSSIGKIEMTDFKMADGKISGKLATKGEVDTFRQKWEVNLEFKTSVPK